MVDRYAQDWEYEPKTIVNRKDGPWVLYADYAALEKRVKELEAELLERKEFYELAAKSYDANSKGWQADIIDMKQRLKEQADEFGRQIQSLHLDVATRDGEIKKLTEELQYYLPCV